MRRQGRTFGNSLVQWLGESYSVHIFRSDRAVLGFRFSNRLLLFFILLFMIVAGGAFFLSGKDDGSLAELSGKSENLQANLSLLEDEVNSLEKVYVEFQKSVNAAFVEMPVTHGREYVADVDTDTIGSGESVEAQLLGMRSGIQDAMDYLGEFRTMMRTRQSILQFIPNRWPVTRGMSQITMEFGPNIHPIRGNWYLHQGVDIAGASGLLVVATANGRVSKIGYEGNSEYGNYVEVEHRFGFVTKYAHLGRIFVTEGSPINAGEAIGTLGNTGTSTGPHMHFEVKLGNQVIDPVGFLKISNTFVRWKGDRGKDSSGSKDMSQVYSGEE